MGAAAYLDLRSSRYYPDWQLANITLLMLHSAFHSGLHYRF